MDKFLHPDTEARDLFYSTAKPLVCPDPENCTELHNEEDPQTNEEHHYGCECSWCIYVYWSLKR